MLTLEHDDVVPTRYEPVSERTNPSIKLTKLERKEQELLDAAEDELRSRGLLADTPSARGHRGARHRREARPTPESYARPSGARGRRFERGRAPGGRPRRVIYEYGNPRGAPAQFAAPGSVNDRILAKLKRVRTRTAERDELVRGFRDSKHPTIRRYFTLPYAKGETALIAEAARQRELAQQRGREIGMRGTPPKKTPPAIGYQPVGDREYVTVAQLRAIAGSKNTDYLPDRIANDLLDALDGVRRELVTKHGMGKAELHPKVSRASELAVLHETLGKMAKRIGTRTRSIARGLKTARPDLLRKDLAQLGRILGKEYRLEVVDDPKHAAIRAKKKREAIGAGREGRKLSNPRPGDFSGEYPDQRRVPLTEKQLAERTGLQLVHAAASITSADQSIWPSYLQGRAGGPVDRKRRQPTWSTPPVSERVGEPHHGNGQVSVWWKSTGSDEHGLQDLVFPENVDKATIRGTRFRTYVRPHARAPEGLYNLDAMTLEIGVMFYDQNNDAVWIGPRVRNWRDWQIRDPFDSDSILAAFSALNAEDWLRTYQFGVVLSEGEPPVASNPVYRLDELADVGTKMRDADFWLWRRHRTKAGEPTKRYNPEHIGIRLTARGRDLVDPTYAYYLFEHLHGSGQLRALVRGGTIPHVTVRDLKKLTLDVQQSHRVHSPRDRDWQQVRRETFWRDNPRAAEDVFEEWHEFPPDVAEEHNAPTPPERAVALGRLLEVVYESPKWEKGKPGKRKVHAYRHRFDKPPLLVTDAGRKQLYVVGGNYTAKPEGLVG